MNLVVGTRLGRVEKGREGYVSKQKVSLEVEGMSWRYVHPAEKSADINFSQSYVGFEHYPHTQVTHLHLLGSFLRDQCVVVHAGESTA